MRVGFKGGRSGGRSGGEASLMVCGEQEGRRGGKKVRGRGKMYICR